MFDELFNNYQWKLRKNHNTHIVYLKPGNELDIFEIKIVSYILRCDI